MSTELWIVAGAAAALVVVAYYGYKKGNAGESIPKKKPLPTEELIDSLAAKITAEKVEKLSLNDTVDYFKCLRLKKGVDVPFVAKSTNNGIESYLIATFNEETNEIENYKLISPCSIDEELQRLLEKEKMVVLS